MKGIKSIVILFQTISCLTILRLGDTQPSVVVTNGEMVGIEIVYDNRTIEAYKGIPYAEPPVGSLRFKEPRPAKPWDEVFNASRYGPSCMQTPPSDSVLLENNQVSENCLTLDVFVPSSYPDDSSLAVMVWIHGGGFVVGQGQLYDPSNMVANGGVIVVTINYRLLSFGFLSTEDENAPGNFGLWDQLLAIKWVKDNAAAFGGDPERITIFGESAGGWSVSLLAMSPQSSGLFQRAISQSGIYTDFMMPSDQLGNTRALAELVNCDGSDTTKNILDCLRRVSAEELVNATLLYGTDFLWYPIEDGKFLVEPPSMAKDMISEYDYMIGFNEAEGYVMTYQYYDVNTSNNETGVTVEEFMNMINGTVYDYISKTVDSACALDRLYDSLALTYTYWEDVEDTHERLLQGVDFLGDFYFAAPSVEMAYRHRDLDKRSTYLYHFTYNSENPYLPHLSLFYAPSWNDKATHADELTYLFFPQLKKIYNERDRNVSDTMITYWTNFAKTGNPNVGSSNHVPLWLEFGDRGEYAEIANITTNSGSDATSLDPKHMFLWLKYLPKLAQDTCSIRETVPPCPSATTEGGTRFQIDSFLIASLCLLYFILY